MSVQGWSVDVRDAQRTKRLDENKHRFQAPAGRVLTGRGHDGDADGETWYHHARLVVVTPQGEFPTRVGTASWSKWDGEADSPPFIAPDGQVLVGREHEGDLTGDSRYAHASVFVTVNGTEHRLTFTHDEEWLGPADEADHNVNAPTGQVLVGRHHNWENGSSSYYRFAVPSV